MYFPNFFPIQLGFFPYCPCFFHYSTYFSKSMLNSEKIWLMRKKSRFNSEKTGTIWEKPKLNREKIWKIHKKIVKSYYFSSKISICFRYFLLYFPYLFTIFFCIFQVLLLWPIFIPSYTISKYYNMHLHIFIIYIK
jgi:hypothetical protein